MIIRSRSGQLIQSLNAWGRFAGPKRPYQWKPGRSAMALAQAWTSGGTPQVPADLAGFLAHHSATAGLMIMEGVPECPVRLDKCPGGLRNCDLVLYASPGVCISVEAKVDEPFGETIDAYLARVQRLGRNSNLPARIDGLAIRVFGLPTSQIVHLRYQLLHGLAGAAIAAQQHGDRMAVLLIHEFRTNMADPAKVRANHLDLNTFVTLLPGCSGVNLVSGSLSPRIHLPGWPDLTVHIGLI